jgi:DNA invertase Pin-like site-specific DNA recombinase
MELVGYARVSTTEQDSSIQITALKAAGCTTLFTEKKVEHP